MGVKVRAREVRTGVRRLSKVLVADDDPALRGLIKLVAARAGFEVDTAVNGIEALEKIRTNRYAIAVVDLMMPRMSGYELVDHLAEIENRPAVLVVTAMNDAQLPQLDGNVVNSIVRKPFDIGMLSAVLTELASTLKRKEEEEQRRADDEGKVVSFPGC
jgi:DNA-binding response OmpR family regulator